MTDSPEPDAETEAETDSEGSAAEEIPYLVDIEAVRAQARMLPGPGPTAINTISVAASIRPRKIVVAGGDDTPTAMPRTAYQLVYADGTVMLDSGLDLETHESFGKGEAEPYYPEQYALLQDALVRAKAIFLSHYHGDHSGGGALTLTHLIPVEREQRCVRAHYSEILPPVAIVVERRKSSAVAGMVQA